jgi:hypothetical protein
MAKTFDLPPPSPDPGPTPLPPVLAAPAGDAWSPQMPFEFSTVPPVQRQSGGVAAFRRSWRHLWLVVLLVTAIVLGFALVRFTLGAVPAHSLVPRPGGLWMALTWLRAVLSG